MAAERHVRGARSAPGGAGRFATLSLLAGAEPSLVRAYAVIVAGPLLLLAAVPAVIIASRIDGSFVHLPIWVALAVQLLVPVGVGLAGRRLRADHLGQVRFGSYAAVVVTAGLGMFLTGEAVIVGAVAAGCLAWVIAVDVAAGRAAEPVDRSGP